MFFFFQAEDGIRDLTVTGVQTCALPICWRGTTASDWFRDLHMRRHWCDATSTHLRAGIPGTDRKSTRLNSSHSQISYAVFCLKTKNTTTSSSDKVRPMLSVECAFLASLP